MEDRQELNLMLHQLRSQGAIDSQGSFTLSLDAALRKLADFRLPKGAYLLKFVQAAVRWGATQVEVRLGARSVRASFDTPWVVDRGVIEQAAASPLGRSPHPGLEHLIVGLIAAREMCERPVCWLWDEAVTACLAVTEGGLQLSFHPAPDSARAPTGCLIELVRKHRNLWTDFRNALRTTAEHHLFAKSTRFAPLAVRLDGMRMNCPDVEGFWGSLRPPSTTGTCLVQRDLIEMGGDLLAIEQPLNRGAEHVELQGQRYVQDAMQVVSFTGLLQLRPPPGQTVRVEERPLGEGYGLGRRDNRWHAAELPLFPFPARLVTGGSRCPAAVRGALSLNLAFEGEGMLSLVKDGVLLESHPAELGCPGAQALVSAAGLRTDLSQLAVLRDGAYQELLSELRAHVAEMVSVVPQELSRLLRAGLFDYSLKKYVHDRLPKPGA